MASKIISIDEYLTDGCGRCKLFQTPQCKVHKWTSELHYLRQIILKSELHEELKWSMPCYSLNGKNVVMLCAFKEHVSLSFFKGALLTDEKKLLISPGENSNSTRQFRFTNLTQIKKVEKYIAQYIKEAIANEVSCKKVSPPSKKSMTILPELKQVFGQDKKLESAFYALTPGRQRGYLLYFSGAKQSATRMSRIQKYSPKILSGKGFHD